MFDMTRDLSAIKVLLNYHEPEDITGHRILMVLVAGIGILPMRELNRLPRSLTIAKIPSKILL
jgi:hypothetical protein